MSSSEHPHTVQSAAQLFLYPVEPSHHKTRDGVRFNVQTVTPQTAALPTGSEQQVTSSLSETAKTFYCKPHQRGKPPDVKIEAHSVFEPLVGIQESLVFIALQAFASHYPLVLSPDDIWLAISIGVAAHINHGDNAEKLRDKFVAFQGKKELEVQKDGITMGHVPRAVWELDIFGGFSKQVREHIGNRAHDVLCKGFSTTTKTQQAALDVTLMAGMQKYFSYKMTSLCGIPWIELKGDRDDWSHLRERAGDLGDFLLPEFRSQWLPYLLPVLDEFIHAYDGKVNHAFWQRMCKVVRGPDSGESDRVSGWINILYPYLNDGRQNAYIKQWHQLRTSDREDQRHVPRKTLEKDGPETYEFPRLLSSVPVLWNYYGVHYRLHFHAGYLGMKQAYNTLALTPHVGWMITHDPEGYSGR